MITAKVAHKPFLQIPPEVYDLLKLTRGEQIEILIASELNDESNRSEEEALAQLDSTQGIWADDEQISEAFEYLERKWAEWKPKAF